MFEASGSPAVYEMTIPTKKNIYICLHPYQWTKTSAGRIEVDCTAKFKMKF